MGMDAELIGIGPYSSELSEFMEYEDLDVPNGTIVIGTLVACSGSSSSRQLAQILGISAHNFQHHCNLDVTKINGYELDALARSLGNDVCSREGIFALHRAGWKFHFKPNG
jgi:hypothetical protein